MVNGTSPRPATGPATQFALGCGNFGGVGSAPAFFGKGIVRDEAFRLLDRAAKLNCTLQLPTDRDTTLDGGGKVTLDGGDLEIEWRADNHIILTGPVAEVFTGVLDRSLL
mgnify:CR=1 FL=1